MVFCQIIFQFSSNVFFFVFFLLFNHFPFTEICNSQSSDVSNFIESDQKVALYQLVVFWVMTPKSDFLLIGDGTITPKGSINTANFGKTSLFIGQGYEQQTSTRLWSLRVNKWFKTHIMGHIHFKKLMKFRKFTEIFYCCMTTLRNTNLGVFVQCQYTITILGNKNMGQSV